MLSIIAGGAVLAILMWRIWRFTVQPILHPEEPKEVPYWIPSSKQSLSKRSNAQPPFALTSLGSTLYIITDPVDVSEVNRRSTAFTLEPLAKDLLLKFGISKTSVERLFLPYTNVNPHEDGKGKGKAQAQRGTGILDATDTILDLYRQHLSPGDRLNTFIESDIIPRMTEILSPTTTLVNGIVISYYGDIIADLQPDFAGRYIAWEKSSWKFLMGLPGFLSRDMLSAKGDMIGLFEGYFSLPPTERGHGNFWVEAVEGLLRGLGLGNGEIGKVFMLHTSSIVGNMYKLSFWLLAHILYDKPLLEAIATEIRPAFNPQTKSVDHTYLTEKCPLLDSLYSEVLRLVVTSPMTRYVSETSTVGGKVLREGSKVLIIYHHLHTNKSTWGPTPEKLQPSRFLNDKTLKTNISYRPWGGGKHVCPGRFLAKKAVFTFVALLLGQYHVGLDGDQSFPRADLAKASGVLSWAEGEDVIVSLSTRTEGH
ncbi:cytochrome P450 [Aspergillus stella-maris]|uniref:cytochrome P450 n=1 Tax=Aspergillus stella-maris TaxID=1810926 RepID=UPI003CCD2449